MQEPFDFIEIKIPAKPEYVGIVRLSISGIANRLGFSFEEIEDLKIAVSEAITNTVQHAYQGVEDGEVTIGFGLYHDRLEIMVADRGGSFDLSEIKQEIGPYRPEESIEGLREGGFGLFLIEELMDKLEINNDYGVIVIMTKHLHKNGVESNDDEISTTQ
ncbi:serine/threonine-protein kinase RsbW [Salinibacillus kushneri]|uniref:Serine-protein kinase RsbW n=1 Tax=Salinibacillus kushneri TaxID=237682 RepID=A0A1I0BKA7_9BACI|nr:anti-sigma B factor RsbW [Salinibacillus kushneri]SET06684.1 serine/threonine-protein kinase RsbW [Salinibacillus kushneri]